MFPHPLAVQAHAGGLGIGYTNQPTISHHEKDGRVFQAGTGYRYPFRQSLLVGLDGIEFEDARLDDYSDWSVTSLWKKGDDELRTTFAHGCPFVYFENSSARPIRIRFSAARVDPGGKSIVTVGDTDAASDAGRVFDVNDGVLGVSLNGSHFGIFGPAGTEWGVFAGDTTDGLISDLTDKHFLSVAVLPDNSPATVQWFEKYAYAFLRDTRIRYVYEPATANVTTTYTATTEPMQGATTDTVFALYRHQHLHTTEPGRFEKFNYVSPRGVMRVLSGQKFKTTIPFLGVLPAPPNDPVATASLSASLRQDFAAISSRTTAPITTAQITASLGCAALTRMPGTRGLPDTPDSPPATIRNRRRNR